LLFDDQVNQLLLNQGQGGVAHRGMAWGRGQKLNGRGSHIQKEGLNWRGGSD